METSRSGEITPAPKRSNRYICSHGIWYFNTRRGRQEGPFVNKKEMQEALQKYIQYQGENAS